MPGPTIYGDITPRTAGHAIKKFLMRAIPNMPSEQFAMVSPIPMKSTRVAIFRRYFLQGATDGGVAGTDTDAGINTPLITQPMIDGVTPASQKFQKQDISATMQRFGGWAEITEELEDLHEDNVVVELTGALGEQAGQSIERLNWGVLKAGANVMFANGTQRSDVNTPFTLALQRRATRKLLGQNAMMITSRLASSIEFSMEPVEPGYVALCHPNVENDIRSTSGYKNPVEYGTYDPLPGEFGAIENVRFLRSTLFDAFLNAGGAAGSMLSTGGVNADVYPIIIMGKDAWGTVPLRGKNAIMLRVRRTGNPDSGDPMGRTGSIAWLRYWLTLILNDAHMIRLEVAATA